MNTPLVNVIIKCILEKLILIICNKYFYCFHTLYREYSYAIHFILFKLQLYKIILHMVSYCLSAKIVNDRSSFADSCQPHLDSTTKIPRSFPSPCLHLFLCSLCIVFGSFSLFPISVTFSKCKREKSAIKKLKNTIFGFFFNLNEKLGFSSPEPKVQRAHATK